ncbi:MAG TPA: UPF0182 family protein [Acidimicrobiales bacterium]|nr:UPF0182 family protein [Acidimicrobiales bacterium]
MRATSDLPQRPRRAIRARVLVGIAVLVIVLIFSLRDIADFYTDYLWFSELKFTSVFRGVLVVQVLLAVFFCLLFFAVMWGNLIISDRLAPKFRPTGPEDEIVQRYREAVGPHAGKVRIIVAAVFAFFTGIGTRSQWNNWVLFRHSTSFGVKDPQFGKDVSFFVFKLPFINFVVTWIFVAIVITLVVSVVFHYLNGGIRVQSPVQRVTPQVKAHISVLLGALALVKAVGYWYQRYSLDLSTSHVVDGATYTSVHANLPALRILIVIAVLAAGLFIYNIYQKGWTLPVIAVGLWALVYVLVGLIYPAVIQAFKVKPAEIVREKPFIQRNINATRAAFGLTNVQPHSLPANNSLTSSDFSSGPTNMQTISNVRVLDPNFVGNAFNKLQEIRSYYTFPDLDTDRYDLGGALTPTLFAVREIQESDVPAGFVNTKLEYTHGYGGAMSPANQSGVSPADGTPNFVISNIPPVSAPNAPPLTNQPRVYYGEQGGNYVITNSAQPELDYQSGTTGNNVPFTYNGKGGVQMGSWLRRAAFALRFGDPNLVLSGLVTSNSRIQYVRNITDRVHKAAPFLKYDADPYAVTVNGAIYWIFDAYTVTDQYPYSQQADTSRVAGNSGLSGTFNYVRNSVKVVIDAYNGSMQFYVWDPKDPIIQTYEKAFPDLFTPASKMPKALAAHVRYPEDLFDVQTNMFGRYHLTDPNDFYTQGNAWTISQDPGEGAPQTSNTQTSTVTASGQVVVSRSARMPPVYSLITLPGQTDQSFVILQPFVPVSPSDKQQNLTAIVTAKGDPNDYGQLDVFTTPAGQQIDGPAQVNSAINANPDISKEITLLNTNGSQVELGNVVTVPIDQSVLYVQPLYVQSASNPIARLDDVIVVYQGAAYHGGTLDSALCTTPFGTPFCALPDGNVPPPSASTSGTGVSTTTPTTTETTTPSSSAGSPTVQQLLAQAQMHFQNANSALMASPPDLGKYQSEIAQAQADVTQAATLTGASTSASSTTTVPGATTTAPAATTTSVP